MFTNKTKKNVKIQDNIIKITFHDTNIVLYYYFFFICRVIPINIQQNGKKQKCIQKIKKKEKKE